MTAWFCQRDGRTGAIKRRSLDLHPSFTICAQGTGDAFAGEYWIEETGESMIPKSPTAPRRGEKQLFDGGKPEYRVPLVSEIAAMPWNGMTVATTFAGCGGSSLGYRMAGFRVVWANEFVPVAQESYRANMAAGTVLDGRDVREIEAAEILKAAKLKVGELDLFDGSPPCQAFSTAGKRERGWGEERQYAHGAKQKNEDLFFEFCRLRDGLQPRAFVAENVSGLVKGAAKGYFLEILRRLKVGYRVEARLLDAQWLGVPQQRQRIIFVGAREDLGLEPAFPAPLPYRYSVRDALPWIGRATLDMGGSFKPAGGGDVTNRPAPTIISSTSHHMKVEAEIVVGRGSRRRRESGEPLSADEPSMSVLADGGRKNSSQFMVQYANGQPPRDITDLPAPTVTAGPGDGSGGGPRNHFKIVKNKNAAHRGKGQEYPEDEPAPTVMARRSNFDAEIVYRGQNGGKDYGERRRSVDEPSAAISSHGYGAAAKHQVHVEERVVQNSRYDKQVDVTDGPALTVGTHGRAKSSNHLEVEVRKIANGDTVPDNVAATLEGYAVGEEWDKLNPGQQSDKFFSLVRPDAGKPCPTITAMGVGSVNQGSPGGTAAVTHPTEKRKFTIEELKRICAFPDDFVLVGTYGQRWERLGNSVPPVMMRHIAEAVRDRVLLPARAAARSAAPAGRSPPRSTSGSRRKGAGRSRS
jgi:site-specific DNA-cytosine methylase